MNTKPSNMPRLILLFVFWMLPATAVVAQDAVSSGEASSGEAPNLEVAQVGLEEMGPYHVSGAETAAPSVIQRQSLTIRPYSFRRFVTHFMRPELRDDERDVSLWFAAPRSGGGIFDKEISEIRDVEAAIKTLTTHRDEQVLIEMDPVVGGLRIVLPINR